MASYLMPLDRIDHYPLSSLISIPSVIALALAWTISKVVYNLYFHPLHSYPGPFLGRAFSIYISILELSGTQHNKVKEWHDTYGEVVRIAPNSLSYNSSQAWEEICGHRSGSHKALFDKDREFFVLPPNGEPNIVAANGEHHRRLRRLLAHAFSEKALRAQEACIKGYIDLFIAQLKDRATTGNGVVNMVHWFNFTTFDVIGDLAFGESFSLLKQGVWSRYLSTVFGSIQFGIIERLLRRLLPLTWKNFTKLIAPKKLLDDRMFQYHLAKDKLARRIAHDTERPDFVHYMLKGSRETIGADGLTFEEMVSQGNLLLLAGSETTASLLSGMLYYLLVNPDVLARLAEEVRTCFPKETEISIQTVSYLPYLQAVIEESLRMYPPVPNALPRSTPQPGEVICGKFVPGGTSVGMHHYACYRSSKNFFEPDSFHPERWLNNGDSRFANDDKNAFHPFSHGPRNCLGKNLAYAEMKLIVAEFFWNFDVELQSESRNWAQQKSAIIWRKNPLYVKLTPRK
ncbi:cytochrome P450 monooxygenase, putative [Talaromyces stipitatus ATCC 10500]|uniref:Cytochrome P450 monooxygenase, putative n=1 Tax=Talaromyces stipitatus (strain ATCC 10500 / CBS 375.48 / QM 6759 / NRRL 1006) TaxID=441959 RepID=B8MDZ7_TALSN|nr:cytochrome P450 monooxygenase, putative [Talaromyces stipitatus ATCC 10500]EED16074.1 cytochrome P450 monooxygenase, putative [Talaromyces stipitatus ATCC 10500]